MIPMRNRLVLSSTGLMTALSMGVLSVAGCASFDPNPVVVGTQAGAQANSPAATGGSQPAGPTTATAAPAAPAGNEYIPVTGLATLAGKPLANASVKVVDAFTGKPAKLIGAGAGRLVAAGAGNLVAAGAGNYALNQAGFQADANGLFKFALVNPTPGAVYRVLATSATGQTVVTLLGVKPAGQSRYNLTANTAANTVISLQAQINQLEAQIEASGTITQAQQDNLDSLLAQLESARRAANDSLNDLDNLVNNANNLAGGTIINDPNLDPVDGFTANEDTTFVSQTTQDVLNVSKTTLTEKARAGFIKVVFNEGRKQVAAVSASISDAQAVKIAESVDQDSGKMPKNVFVELTGDSRFKLPAQVFVRDVLKALQTELVDTEKRNDKTGVSGLTDAETEKLEGLGIDIKFTPGKNEISITSDDGSIGITFGLPGDTGTGDPGTAASDDVKTTTQESEISDPKPTKPKHYPASSTTRFSPTLGLESDVDGNLEITVGQTAGEDDVYAIVARISKALTGAEFLSGGLTTGGAMATSNHAIVLADGGGLGILRPSLTGNDIGNVASTSLPLSVRMGGGTLQAATWTGFWNTDDGDGRSVAHLRIYDAPSSPFIYLSMEYALSNAAIKVVQAHTTTLTLQPSVLPLDLTRLRAQQAATTGAIDVDIYSRNGSFSEFNENFVVPD